MLDWTPEELRRHGYAAVDALAEHWARMRDQPIRDVAPIEELEAAFGQAPPEEGRPFEEVLHDTTSRLLPNTMHVNHPRFFGFVPGPSNPTGAIAEMLAAGFNVFAGTWMGGGAATVVERSLLRWLASEIGLPAGAGGVMVSGGSHANLTALVVARQIHPLGRHPDAAVYFSDQTHSASERALRVLGFRDDQLRRLPSDSLGRLDVAALHSALGADTSPFCVIANAGATSTGAVDDLPTLAGICRARGLWLHADAAFGGAAAIAPRGKQALRGLEECDSMALDPHKWLFQPFGLGCVLVREERWLSEVFRIIPAYMNDVYRLNAEINFCDRGLELTRPFRALKLWMSLQHFGAAAFRSAIERGFQLAELAEARLRCNPEWEILTPAQMAVVTFRRKGDDALQKRLVDGMMADGYALLTSTIVSGRTALRLCPINPRTTGEEILETIARLEKMALQQ
ncbi:MAG: aminotransferase class V-fold PLP-dependent enzyme [Candidatus Solibacter usitatus]|nr:aminotransferase class V-fold PLP-dependent enzyme [Candidatus Solibacter usitatus]